MSDFKFIFFAILCFFLCPQPAAGIGLGPVGLVDDALMDTPTKFKKKPYITVSSSYALPASFANSSGKVSVVRNTIKAGYSIFELTYGVSNFLWEDAGEFSQQISGGESSNPPFENLQDLTLEAHLANGRFYKDWIYWLDCTATSAFEKNLPGALGLGLQGGLAYDLWKGSILGGGVKAVAVSPINDELFGDIELGLVLSVSYEAIAETLKMIGVEMGDGKKKTIGMTVAMSGSNKIYETDGFVKETQSKFALYLDYSPYDNWTLSIGPEYIYDRSYTFYSSNGRKLSAQDLGDSFGGLVKFMWRF
ncbi:hypothetical protein [Maridesulfovibrio sp.]|uniref:hypothetical protein n=1 Tax=Maridesulfovibrio sp. TaxID=2795000 RepID=UPI0029CA204D|nr:hypothetical protein [Maridesulfovibrio sp.]